MTTQTPLETGLALLDAEQVENGYKYFDDASRKYWLVSEGDVEDLGRRLQADESDAYSLWCGDTVSEECPTMTIHLSGSDWHLEPRVRILLAHLCIHDADCNGHVFEVEKGDHTWVECDDEALGVQIMAAVSGVRNDHDEAPAA